MRNAGLEEAQAGIKIARRKINNLTYADDTTLMAESEEELKSLLMKVKEESENVGLEIKFKSGRLIPPAPIFFLKTILAISVFRGVCFHMNCEIFCSSSVN